MHLFRRKRATMSPRHQAARPIKRTRARKFPKFQHYPFNEGEVFMLTPHQIELVKATVPVLQAHGVDLTKHFYARMLSKNPELRNVFNQAHQARGAQQQGARRCGACLCSEH